MAATTTLELHDRADQAAARGDFESALRFSATALSASPLDSRARLKVGLCLAAFGRPDLAVAALKLAAMSQLRRGYVLSAIGLCRDALGIQPGAPEILALLEAIHGRIFGLEGKARGRAAPPAPPVPVSEADAQQFLAISERNLLLDRAARLALHDPDPPDMGLAAPGPVALFSDLSRSAFLLLVQRMAFLKVPPGHVVLREGEPGQGLYMIVQGEAVVTRTSEGESRNVARLGPGAVFGEFALLRAKPRQATVTTAQPSELFEIARQVVEEIAGSNPSMTEELAVFARRRLIMNMMATSKIFHPFDDAQRLEILRAFVTRLVEPGSVIIEENTAPAGLYVVLEGEVEVSKRDEQGDKVVLAYLREGEVFGEIALLENRATTATVAASDRSVLLYLDRNRFVEFAAAHPAIRGYLASLAGLRQEEIRQAMSSEGVVLDMDDVFLV